MKPRTNFWETWIGWATGILVLVGAIVLIVWFTNDIVRFGG